MRYIGSKRNLLGFIEQFVKQKNIKGNVFCDLFAGTTSVGRHFKKLGYKIISSDLLYSSYVWQKVYIEQNQYPKFEKLLEHLKIKPFQETLFTNDSQNAKEIINYLNNLKGSPGFIYYNYAPGGTNGQTYVRKYFTDDNAKKIDAVREKIDEWKQANLINDQEYFFLLCSLIEAVSTVANTCGIYTAFLKHWDEDALRKLALKVPNIINSNEEHKVFNINGIDVLDQVKGVDIIYLDPPYKQRQYAENYHVLETIAKWDKPEIKGVTGRRSYEDQKSEFCNPRTAIEALEKILNKNSYKHLFLSYSNEGIMSNSEIIELLSKYGETDIIEKNYRRYKSNKGESPGYVTERIYYLRK